MSTTTLDRPETPASIHLSFPRVVASEVRKMFSLRSTWWTLGIAVVLQVGAAALVGWAVHSAAASGGGAQGQGFTVDLSQIATFGLQFSQLAVVALAVLTITSEYSSGQIRVTLAAVPRRLQVLWAKSLVLVVVVALLGAVASALAVGVAKLIGGESISFALPGAETARILAGAPLYLVGIAILSLGVGGLLRHTAGAMAGLMGFLMVVQNLFLIPLKALQVMSPWLPGTAGQKIMATDADVQALRDVPGHVGAVLDPWVGYGVLIAWAALALIGAAVMLRKRDA